jgi:LPS-assembly protein
MRHPIAARRPGGAGGVENFVMTDGPGLRDRFRTRLWAGAALMALIVAPLAWAPSVALAADPNNPDSGSSTITSSMTGPSAAEAARPRPVDEGLGERGFYLETDLLIRDGVAKTVTAQGGVEARYQGRTLRADQVVYDTVRGVVTARGHVQIINDDGTAQFADEMVLDDDLKAGIARGFSTRLGGNAKIAAATAVRKSQTVTELNNVIYTPCPICAEDGTPITPTWSIKAQKVTQDRTRAIVYYKNAVIEMFGFPVFYAPVFWHADPQAERMSGLLAPRISISKRRGLSYEQPYLQVISPSQDVIISPQLNSNINPFLNLAWRKRFYSGTAEARIGYTYENDLTSEGDRIGAKTSRSYILADGKFDIDQNWKWGFTAQRTSDDLIFDKYDIGNVFEDHGLVSADDYRLVSQIYTTRQDARSYFSLAAVSIQGLRASDVDRTIPTIAPLIEGRWEPEDPILGGRLRLSGSAVGLTRDQSTLVATDPGVDSRRGTFEADWRRTLTFSNGLRVSPFADVRADLYNVTDLPGSLSSSSATIGRGLGVVGVDVSYPLIRRDGERTIVLEPQVQLDASPYVDLDPRIPNEDSSNQQFDETNLFRTDKFTGFDLYEGGLRANVGGRATVFYDDGRGASLLVGRSYRAKPDPAFPASSGLRDRQSDWIVAGDITPIKGLTAFARTRIDSTSSALRRIEAGADIDLSRVSGYIRYLRDDPGSLGIRTEDVDFRGQVLVTKHWGFSLYGVRDVQADVWRRRDVGLVYQDDCIHIEVVYEHGETFNRSLGPSDSLSLRLTLATLGDTGYSGSRSGY